jgi:hypothetical protein
VRERFSGGRRGMNVVDGKADCWPVPVHQGCCAAA